MPRLTKAEKEAIELKSKQEALAKIADNWLNRLLTNLSRVTALNGRIDVANNCFTVEFYDASNDINIHSVNAEFSDSELAMLNLECDLWFAEESVAKAKEKQQLRKNAIDKLSDAEKEALGLK